MNPRDLIRIARRLASGTVGGNRGRPRQAELRRAVSAAYYAMFHALALSNANTLAGAARANRDHPAWNQTYRALEHGYARNQCNNQSNMGRLPPEIRDFGRLFVFMQGQRNYADYDPSARFSRQSVAQLVDESDGTITRFEDTSAADRRAFALYVLLRIRR